MSLFDSASLVVTPNGTKASKLYAIKPTDGSGDLSVTRATTATRVNSSGLISSVATNIPRLDYTNGSCPSILVEPQRTNLFSYSEQFDNAYWGKTNMVIVANDTTAPDGTTTADKATASFYPSTSISKSNLLTATNHTLSVYVKAGSVSTFRLDLVTAGFALGSNCIFNLSTLATTITNYGTTTGTTAKITSVGNGWYRCSLTVLTTAVTYFAQLYPAANGSVYLWGAQLEAGSYATSYIPTVASSVTRNADVISKTGISSLIGQTEGTVLFDYIWNNRSTDVIPLSIYGNNGKFIWFRQNGVQFYGNSSSLLFNANSTSVYGNRYKLAFVYGQNDFRIYINGTLVNSSSSGTFTGSFSDITTTATGLNFSPFNDSVKINSITLWKTKLTNTELATLTTI